MATRPLVWRHGGGTRYYTHDGNKNVSEVVDAGNAIAAHYAYTPFGAVREQSGALSDVNLFRFSCEYADCETATVYYNYRHYEPKQSKWMSRDQVEPKSDYFFVNNNSITRFDLLGLDGKDSLKKNDCIYHVYVAHGKNDLGGNLWERHQSQKFPLRPNGNRYGYWGCGANVFNEMVKTQHPGFELPIHLPKGRPLEVSEIDEIVNEGLPRDLAQRIEKIGGNVHESLTMMVDELDMFAKNNDDFKCHCTTITIQVECSPALRNAEVFGSLSNNDRNDLFAEIVMNRSRTDSDQNQQAYNRFYDKYKEELKCGKSFPVKRKSFLDFFRYLF